jgi:hypothetical protein
MDCKKLDKKITNKDTKNTGMTEWEEGHLKRHDSDFVNGK